MTTVVKELISQRVLELKAQYGWTMADISRQLGRNPTYLQQYINRGVPVELDEQDRFKLAAILELNPDSLKGPGKPRKYISVVDGPPPVTSKVVSAVNLLADNKRSQDNPPPNPAKFHPGVIVELPVYSAVQEGDKIIMARRPFATFRSPIRNLSAKAYCVTVADDSMSPEHRRGSMAIADPGLQYQVETTCVFRENPNIEDGGPMVIRRIKEIRADGWLVYQHSKPGNGYDRVEQTLLKSEYAVCHVTVGNIFHI